VSSTPISQYQELIEEFNSVAITSGWEEEIGAKDIMF